MVLSPTGGGGDGSKDGNHLETRVQDLEDRWQQLNSLPTGSEMFRRLHKFKQIEEGVEDAEVENAEKASEVSLAPLCRPRQPMLELWHAIQLLNQVENNTAGITRVRHPRQNLVAF